MLNQRLGIDEKDQIIVSLLQQNATISQNEIAEKVKLSQPSVGMRIHKLKQKGILTSQMGMNFKKVNLFLAKVDVAATNTDKVIESFSCCPFFLNGLVVTGTKNMCLFFMSPDMKILEGVINYHLRAHPNVIDVKMDMVITPVRDLIFPVSIIAEDPKNKKEFKQKCIHCPYKEVVYSK